MFLELSEKQQARLVQLATSLIGIPYELGAEIPDLMVPAGGIAKIDCSELVEYCYYNIGIKVTDGSYNQFDASWTPGDGQKIGDTVYMRTKATQRIGHVGLIVGPGVVIEANGFYGKVIQRNLSGFSKETKNNIYAGSRRFLADKVRLV